MDLRDTPANERKMKRVLAHLQKLCDEMLHGGVHGLATIELLIVDGTIHRISRRMEIQEK